MCQKVIVPVSYVTKGQALFTLKAADVKDVLKEADTPNLYFRLVLLSKIEVETT